MDEFKFRANLLADLPPEVLHLVTRNMDAESAMKIYAAGDQVLNRKLMNGGLKELFLGGSPQISCSWHHSRLLRIRNLLQLHIDAEDKDIAGFDLSTIDLLPERMESLRLRFRGALSMWIRRYDADRGEPIVRAYKLGTKFPFLRVLELMGQQWIQHEVVHKGVVEIIQWSAETHAEFVGGLPMSLRRLKLDCGLISGMLDKIPRHLTSLDLEHCPTNGLEFLPKKLQRLAFHSMTYDCFSFLPLNALRHTLTSLTFGSYRTDASAFSSLPQGLLHLYLPHMTNGISESDLKLLPRGLLTLDLSSFADATNNSAFLLPPALTVLRLGAIVVSKPFFNALPRHITSLQLETPGPLEPDFGTDLPPCLHELFMTSCVMDQQQLSSLPPSVIYVYSAPIPSQDQLRSSCPTQPS
jgi:hypothetical protein